MSLMTDSSPLPCAIDWLTAADGVRLLVRRYGSANGNPARTLLWCHGIGEHGGRHEHVVAELLRLGWQVIIPDLRGHGASTGVRADVAAFSDYLADWDLIARHYEVQPRRTALFGHSFGGLVMARWIQTRNRDWAALVMSAPLLGIAVDIPWWKWWLGRCCAVLAPRTHLKTGIREANLTTDPELLAKRRADPCIQRSVTVRWFFAMLKELEFVHWNAAQITIPVLVLQGAADRTTDPRRPREWLSRTGSQAAHYLEYPTGLHELLHDTDWRTVCADMAAWLDQHLPVTGTPA